MRILIRESAAQVYRATEEGGGEVSRKYRAILLAVEGQELEVETEHLFVDEFNVGPIFAGIEMGLEGMEARNDNVDGQGAGERKGRGKASGVDREQ